MLDDHGAEIQSDIAAGRDGNVHLDRVRPGCHIWANIVHRTVRDALCRARIEESTASIATTVFASAPASDENDTTAQLGFVPPWINLMFESGTSTNVVELVLKAVSDTLNLSASGAQAPAATDVARDGTDVAKSISVAIGIMRDKLILSSPFCSWICPRPNATGFRGVRKSKKTPAVGPPVPQYKEGRQVSPAALRICSKQQFQCIVALSE